MLYENQKQCGGAGSSSSSRCIVFPGKEVSAHRCSSSGRQSYQCETLEAGVEALAAKSHPGGTSKLSEKQKDKLIDVLLVGPTAAGYRTDLWNCSRVAKVVRERFRVEYHPGDLSRILHDLEFSPQKPRQIAREQDPEAVERWCEEDWPRIKKNASTGRQHCFNR